MVRLAPRSTLFPYTTLFRSLLERQRRRPRVGRLRVVLERDAALRSEEHTSELQSLRHLVCRLLLEKKNCSLPWELSICCSTSTGGSRCSSVPCSHCFFWNDTATTEIYTLSLHDALPISLETIARTSGSSLINSLKQSSPPMPPMTDRKSTRLNSSHLGISYAVFCLK